MGREDYHLHEFAAGSGERFGDPDPDDPELKSDRTGDWRRGRNSSPTRPLS